MALQTQIGAYDDCFDLFDRAIADPVGIRAQFDSFKEAQYFQMRMHQARSLMRKESRRIYETTDPQYDKSEYDKLVVRSPREDTEGKWWVYIERFSSQIQGVETLGDAP